MASGAWDSVTLDCMFYFNNCRSWSHGHALRKNSQCLKSESCFSLRRYANLTDDEMRMYDTDTSADRIIVNGEIRKGKDDTCPTPFHKQPIAYWILDRITYLMKYVCVFCLIDRKIKSVGLIMPLWLCVTLYPFFQYSNHSQILLIQLAVVSLGLGDDGALPSDPDHLTGFPSSVGDC